MKSEVGFFQVEEVLIPKIQSSPAKHLIELYAGVEGEDMKRYIWKIDFESYKKYFREFYGNL